MYFIYLFICLSLFSLSIHAYTIQLHLKATNKTILSHHFHAVANPKHPEYQNFISKERIERDLIHIPSSSVRLIRDWIHSSFYDPIEYRFRLNHQILELTTNSTEDIERNFHVTWIPPTLIYSSTPPTIWNTTIQALVYGITGLMKVKITRH